MINFKIEDKEFTIPNDINKNLSFCVNSVPNNYNVKIEKSDNIAKEIEEKLNQNPNNLLLIDKNVRELYLKKTVIDDSRIFIIEPNEEFKTLDNGVLKALDFLVKHEFTKAEELVVIGGGITEDIGAFIGACYKRGIKWIFYPTTLLSMCDSCIGGKTGINYKNIKNQIALFSAPREVIININFLKTLPEFHIKSGLGEILKLLVTGGQKLTDIYLKNIDNGNVINFDDYSELIIASLAVKKSIVEEDEFEKNYRKALNYGHTLGHAIEVLSGYKIPHGQAVIIGMIIVNKMAYSRGILDKNDYILTNRLSKELLKNIDTKLIKINGMDKLLKNDKKTEGNLVNFVIISKLGDTKFLKLEINKALISEIKDILESEF